MSARGEAPPDAVLKKYSMELIGCIDDMKHKRDVLHKQILNDAKEKDKLQNDLKLLTGRLVKVNESICDKVIAKSKIEETIIETESAFGKVIDGTGSLVSFMKKVTATIYPILEQTENREEVIIQERKKKIKRTDGTKR